MLPSIPSACFSLFWPAIELIGAAGTIMVIWFGGRWLVQGELTVGKWWP